MKLEATGHEILKIFYIKLKYKKFLLWKAYASSIMLKVNVLN